MAETFGGWACKVGREWTYLQLGQAGEDLERMTSRWQFKHANATMLVPEECCLVESIAEIEPLHCSEQLECGEMLSSRSSF